MIYRSLSEKLTSVIGQFPVTAVLGPRQSGKTTLLKALFGSYTYVNLELPEIREYAETDPKGFLEKYKGGAVLDEVQNVPGLFPYIQVLTDERGNMGEYILTGSQHFLLMEKISQSLAGRVALFNLLPFSAIELKNAGKYVQGWEDFLFFGGYPRIYDQGIRPTDYYPSYIQTYIERDVRKLLNVVDLNQFRKFLMLLAGRAGQLLNLNGLAIDAGISNKTAESWISVLEASFIVFRLAPYYRNFNKRVIKSPKLYFYDTGVLCSLLGLRDESDVDIHFQRGALFENLVIMEFLKLFSHSGQRQDMFFYRDSNNNEIDLLFERSGKLYAFELKSGKTITRDYLKGLKTFSKLHPETELTLVYGGNENYGREGISICGFDGLTGSFLERFAE